ncbi:MAG: HAMP domain-containing sensor histidine kinase [Bacteroidales bacterium]
MTTTPSPENYPDLQKTTFTDLEYELKTPLNLIIGFSAALGEGTFLAENKEYIHKTIRSNTALLFNMIDEIQELFLLDTKRAHLNLQAANINELCKDAISTFTLFKTYDIQVLFHPEYDSFYIQTDSEYLKKVISHLLSNAFKFSAKGTVVVSYEIKDQFVRFSVTDDGPGIPADKLELIFDRYIKLNPKQKGLGLGLPISKEIINRLGGSIYIDNEYNNGCRCIFTHPVNITL